MLDSVEILRDGQARRRLGRYDTPEHVALPLVRWGLAGRPGKVLDPSFGGCSFLRAALQVLGDVGAAAPGRLVYGVDVALETDVYRRQLVARGVPKQQLLLQDFFTTWPERFPPVDLVVGNPPYIRHHWFQRENRELAVAAVARQDVRLHGRANAWAYFLIHASAFLRRGGRMAFLLPGAVLFADYAQEVMDYVRHFAGSCSLVRIGEQFFRDAREETVVLLVENWGSGPCQISVADVEKLTDLMALLDGEHKPCPRAWIDEASGRLRSNREELPESWERLLGHRAVRRLGDLATVRIGVVTGANRYFVRDISDARRLEEDGASTIPILARGRALEGLCWTDLDQQLIETLGEPSRLVTIAPDARPRGAVAAWIALGEEERLQHRLYCRKRKPWYAISDREPPHAFLRYMGGGPPRVVLNGSGATATNAIHRLWWRQTQPHAEAIAVGSCTSLFALACELLGRSYGGGVLKIEPGAAVELPVPVIPAARRAFEEIDRRFRRGESHSARQLADAVVLEQGLGFPGETIEKLRRAADSIAQRRCREKG